MTMQVQPDPGLLQKVPAKFATNRLVLPLLLEKSGAFKVAMVKTTDLDTLEDLRVLLGGPVDPVTWAEKDLNEAIQNYYGFGAGAIEEIPTDVSVEKVSPLEQENQGKAAMVRFVNDLISRAYKERATDIHIEPFEDELFIRFRIDGVLHPIPIPKSLTRFQSLLISRLKVMSHMNIAEKRLPQDGRIWFSLKGIELDIRVSTLPTIYGESLDMRLLPRKKSLLTLDQLGMNSEMLKKVESLIQKPNGIFLVTGPTGHGKSTTLYACLNQINTTEKKIITVEDPVEVRLRGANQMQVKPEINLVFATGLRSILRQDPDVIMVGEIRDMETAEIAIRASLTGHLVFSTLHTNNAIGAITRLIDMKVEPYLVASSVNAVLAQRLVRLICQQCNGNKRKTCKQCHNTGYFGRTGVFELLVLNDDIRQLIQDKAPIKKIHQAAQENGLIFLKEDGNSKIKKGLTTHEEINRVADAI